LSSSFQGRNIFGFKMILQRIFGYLLLLGVGQCLSVRNVKVFEELRDAPEGWEAVGAPSPNTRLDFRLALQAVC
jgi:hypothetical protein